MDNLLIYRIDSLLEHIDLVLNDTNGLAIDEFEKTNVLVRATCFSISQIGEMMNQLEKALSPKYDRLPWVDARNMRNVIVHDYGGTDVEQVYSTIHEDLPKLKRAFIAIKNDLVNDTLVTDRLILRKFQKEDATSVFKNWASDPEVTKYLTWNPHENIEITKQIINRWMEEYKNSKTIRYGITLKENNELIGAIDIVDYTDDNPEIGYCLSRQYWNKGIMTEACKAFVKYLQDIGFNKILITAVEDNIGSNKVIEKCGFVFSHKEKLEHQSAFKPNPVTINCYELVK